ncbi:hypothetical protein SUGI_0649270 [Cryptomeria japonica]|uniref:uncharacterized protein LOC131062958 n=1 Tax=Cryptomeria japonica TaxID=3369 RepID=UPI002414BDD8|nr:uncharacterized protein LOC131062958 [Cryptomeria japonica]GLJ32259.1 hypothetical protein SUGI_0649270 [Cryptomeria japonica]
MECWIHDQWPVNGESSFAERQAMLKAQVFGSLASGLESCGNFEQRFWPYDQLLIKHEELYGAGKSNAPVSSWGPDGAFNFAASNFNEEESQQCGFELESLPIQMQGFGNFQFVPVPDFQDEDFGYAELNLPVWQTQPNLSEVCCASAERPRNSSFYTLEDVMKKLPRVAPLLIPSPPMNLGIPPSPQFSSDVSLSSCLPFSARVSCPPASLQPSESETEHLNQFTQLQSCRKPQYASVEPQSVAARHRRSKIRERIRSLEKLIPQGSKLDTARMLDEAIKYLKFLQAQVQVLEAMPHGDSKPDLKSNPNGADDKENICLKSNYVSDAARKIALTNALTLHRSGSASASPKKLSANQMLHSLLSSSRIQKKLFSAGKIIVTVQQKETLASARPDLSGDFSNFLFD